MFELINNLSLEPLEITRSSEIPDHYFNLSTIYFLNFGYHCPKKISLELQFHHVRSVSNLKNLEIKASNESNNRSKCDKNIFKKLNYIINSRKNSKISTTLKKLKPINNPITPPRFEIKLINKIAGFSVISVIDPVLK
ncbi:hypothetical protein BpHYR1_011878 [Brachionus plicatilis]|uniref:Uncharacterized protein n=1 Tax=Brachionus plicatilis TaxID=10195 RepID=A0A3M7RPX2_BRAPC|nr:hypothetical protein BpHYR1_011878 [Brachionus plicatilis]